MVDRLERLYEHIVQQDARDARDIESVKGQVPRDK